MPFARCHSAGRVHYAERGERRPERHPVLLIHGAGASSAIWMMVMARVARVTRAVAVDLPGHGPSPRFSIDPGNPRDGHETSAQPTIIDYRNAAGEVAALTGLGPSVLVGHSMGALVALEAALAWPDKVVGLVLCGAAPRLPISRELVAALKNDYPRFPEWLAARALSPAAKPALRRAFVAAGVVAPQEVTLADFAAIDGIDLGPRLSQVRCPILWLHGADDRIVAAQPARPDAQRVLPGAQRVLSDVGHLVPIEAPAEVAAAAIALAETGQGH